VIVQSVTTMTKSLLHSLQRYIWYICCAAPLVQIEMLAVSVLCFIMSQMYAFLLDVSIVCVVFMACCYCITYKRFRYLD